MNDGTLKLVDDRNRALACENENLKAKRDALENEISYREYIVSLQHLLAALGKEHIQLLESITGK